MSMSRIVKHLPHRFAVLVVALSLFTATTVGAEKPQPKPSAFVPGSWTMVLLPDTQHYADQYPGLFMLQTHWIAQNKDKYNIRYVLQLGDITNGSTRKEWERARDSMSQLHSKVPYAMVCGNHDYRPLDARSTLFPEYFPLATFKTWPSFGGAMGDEPTNTYHLFTAGGSEWIIIALEWAPRNEAIEWANRVLAKYPHRRAILVTHAYLYNDNTRYDFAAKKRSQKWSPYEVRSNWPINDGEQLWQKLVRKNRFVLTCSGHVLGDGLGFLSSKNDRGKTVQQMLVDYQTRTLGGEGYLRILEFLPDGKTVHAKSYSPLYDRYLTDPDNQFAFTIDP
jgi:hypothetical protein